MPVNSAHPFADAAILTHKAKWEKQMYDADVNAEKFPPLPPPLTNEKKAEMRRKEGYHPRRPRKPNGIQMAQGGHWNVRPPPLTTFLMGFHASTIGVDPFFSKEGPQWVPGKKPADVAREKSRSRSHRSSRTSSRTDENGNEASTPSSSAGNGEAHIPEEYQLNEKELNRPGTSLGYELRARRRHADYGLGEAGRSRRHADEVFEKEYPMWGKVKGSTNTEEDREAYEKYVREMMENGGPPADTRGKNKNKPRVF
ncbi:hypothetical protein RI054_07g37450 [Pseudoscourfieldia marina]